MSVTTLEFPGEDVTVGGSNVTVRGTASPGEVITVTGGNIILDASFTLGGDTIVLPGVASQYSAVIVGSRIVLSGPGVEVSIPLSANGITVDFANGDERFLEINDQGQVVLGDQEIPFGPTSTDLDAGGPASLDFTTAADDLQGTADDDVFDGSLDVGIDGLVGVQTVQGADSADGGEGMDTLNAELNSTGTTSNPQLTAIEVFNLTAYSNILGNTSVLNLARSSGYEQLWNRMSDANLTLNNVGSVAILGLDSVQADTTYRVNYDGIGVETQTVVAMGNGFPPAGNTFTDYVTLDINGVADPGDGGPGFIGTLDLRVSEGNALYLENDAASPDNLLITGSGLLDLVSDTNFWGLYTLDSTGYTGDLALDISGSSPDGSFFLEDVATGVGDDDIIVAANAFTDETDPTSVDLGEGENSLTLLDNSSDGTFNDNGALDEDEVSALDFTSAPVENVQTLNLQDVTLNADATLDLTGITDLTTLQLDSLNASASLDIMGGPDTLTIQGTGAGGNLDFGHNNLTVQDTSDLSLGTAGDFSGYLFGDDLVNVDIATGDDTHLHMYDAASLETLTVDAGSTEVYLEDTDGDPADGSGLESLAIIDVQSDSDAYLSLTGAAGITPVAGLQEIWELSVDSAPNGSNGSLVVSSEDLDGGSVLTDYNENAVFGESNANDVADDIAADLNASGNPLTATVSNPPIFQTDNTITITWDDPGNRDNPSLPLATGAATFSISVVQEGVDEVTMVPGTGFQALNEVTVNAAANAYAYLTDVYGDFTLMVEAGDTADVDLTNTEVSSLTVDATDSTIGVHGDTVGGRSLADITVTGETTQINLDDDLSSLDLLDVTGVTDDVFIDAVDAGYEVAPNAYVDYQVGATDDGLAIDYDGGPVGPGMESVGSEDIRIGMDLDTREVVTFTSGDFGEARLGLDGMGDAYFTVDGPDYDRIDLSQLGYTNAGQLQFEVDGNGDLIITDLVGSGPSMSGTIVIDIVSGSGNFGDGPGDYTIDDFASNNIIFA